MSSVSHEVRVGRYTCTVVTDGDFAYEHPAAVFFCNAPADELSPALRAHHIDPGAWPVYVSPYPSLVIDTGEERVLVDVGGGTMGPETGRLLPNLKAAGIDPDSIDLIVLTHGHADHINGLVTPEGELVFPKARYVMWKEEWEFWTGNPDLSAMPAPDWIKQALIHSAKYNLPPIADRVKLIEVEGEIVPGVCAVAAPGHTPGHMAVSVTSGGEQLLHLVDVGLHPIHLEHPEWYVAMDLLPEQTAATRRKLFQRAAEEQVLVMLYHFPAPGLGHIVRSGPAWAWEPV